MGTQQRVSELKSNPASKSQEVDSVCQECREQEKKAADEQRCNAKAIKAVIKSAKSEKVLKADDKCEVFEIIGGIKNNLQQLKLELEQPVGPCDSHKGKVFDSRSAFNSKNDTAAIIDAPSSNFSFYKSGNFYGLKDCNALNYQMAANTCGRQDFYSVDVYPDAELSFSFGLDFGKGRQNTKANQNGQELLVTTTSSKVSTAKKFEYAKDGLKTSIDFTKLEHIMQQLSSSVELIECGRLLIIDLVGSAAELTIDYPCLNVEYSSKFSDDDNPYFSKDLVYLLNSVKVELKPLIGFTWKLDLIKLGMMTLPGGCAIIKVKDMVEKFIKEKLREFAEVKLEGSFTLKGGVDGTAHFDSLIRKGTLAIVDKSTQTKKGTTAHKNGVKIEGKITLELLLEAYAGFTSIMFSAGAGVRLKSSGGVSAYADFYGDEGGHISAEFGGKLEKIELVIMGYYSVGGPKIEQKSANADRLEKYSTEMKTVKADNDFRELYRLTLVNERKKTSDPIILI